MNRNEFETLTKPTPPVMPRVSVDALNDVRDRTLLYGYTTNRDTWHVYLEGGLIHRHIYGREGGQMVTIDHDAQAVWDARELVPNKRAYPAKCDYEFCRLLASVDVQVTFTTFDDDVAPADDGYYGERATLATSSS